MGVELAERLAERLAGRAVRAGVEARDEDAVPLLRATDGVIVLVMSWCGYAMEVLMIRGSQRD